MTSVDDIRHALDAALAVDEYKEALELVETYRNEILVHVHVGAEGTAVDDLSRDEYAALTEKMDGAARGEIVVRAVLRRQWMESFAREMGHLQSSCVPPDEFWQRCLAHCRRNQRLPLFKTLYDSMGGSGCHPPVSLSTCLFGNANIGNARLTNLQTPGQFSYDNPFLTTSWRASLVPDLDYTFRGVARFETGHRAAQTVPIHALRHRSQPMFSEVASREQVRLVVDLEQEDQVVLAEHKLYLHVDGWES